MEAASFPLLSPRHWTVSQASLRTAWKHQGAGVTVGKDEYKLTKNTEFYFNIQSKKLVKPRQSFLRPGCILLLHTSSTNVTSELLGVGKEEEGLDLLLQQLSHHTKLMCN